MYFLEDEAVLGRERAVLLNVKSYLHDACEELYGCPLFMLDEVFDDQEHIKYFELKVYNKAYSKMLSVVGLKLVFDHLKLYQRHTVFTVQHCEASMVYIANRLCEGMLKDYIALSHILNFRKLECKVFLRGNEILCQ